MKYYLRAVTTIDFDFLYRLKVVCLKEYVTAIWGWDEAFQKRHFAAHFDPAAGHIVVAFGRDVGQVSVENHAEFDYLSGIYLLPAYQRLGLGSELIRDVLAKAGLNSKPVHLQVLVGNPALDLYRRLGFKVVDKTATHLIMHHGPKRPSAADA